jgi:predicted  nucleic acid-binding Zn-ribbon protein
MSQTLSLYRLQQTDSQIDRIQARLKVIQNILDDNVELNHANELTDSSKAHYQTVNQAMKIAENAVYDQRIKIEQTEASLYSGNGHTPKELQDLQNDLTSLKHHLHTLEDVQLESMVAVEEAEKQNQTSQALLNAVTIKSQEQNQSLHQELNSLQKELQKLFSERAANADSIPLETINLYDQLRQQRRGIAVAVVSDKSCSACGSGLSPAQIQASRSSGQIALCPSCGRILYGS